MLKTGAIVESLEEEGQFVSTIFTVPKPDGSRRPIINLKRLNEYVETPHFKMENIRVASQLVSRDAFMCVIDLKDAYHSIRICPEHRKYLKFRWKGKLYHYVSLPFGLSIAPWVYTKITKPIAAFLRTRGIVVVCYLDDTLLISSSFTECSRERDFIISLFQSIGFKVNKEKSQLNPVQNVQFLGFRIDSGNMLLLLPVQKQNTVIRVCEELFRKSSITIQRLSEVIGTLVAASPATRYGMLYTRQLEHEKGLALLNSGGSYSSKMIISEEGRKDLTWWISNVKSEFQHLHSRSHDVMLTSDASLKGWGAERDGNTANGPWPLDQAQSHINVLELWAVYYGLRSLVRERNVVVLCRVDSQNAMAYINKLGGCRSVEQHKITKTLFEWCQERNIILRSSYIDTKSNATADFLSRNVENPLDVSLSRNYFDKVVRNFGVPEIDLFASFRTFKCRIFYSYQPDPYASGVDAFTYKWRDNFYAFPPFSMISKVINKILEDACEGILIVPNWPSQSWFPLFHKYAIGNIVKLGPNKKLLFDPCRNDFVQVTPNMSLLATRFSGKPTAN
jgi:hypothetical protein